MPRSITRLILELTPIWLRRSVGTGFSRLTRTKRAIHESPLRNAHALYKIAIAFLLFGTASVLCKAGGASDSARANSDSAEAQSNRAKAQSDSGRVKSDSAKVKSKLSKFSRTATAMRDGITLTLTLEDSVISVAKRLKGTLVAVNTTKQFRTLRFTSTCQLGYTLRKGNKVVLQYPGTCGAALSQLDLKAGESHTYPIDAEFKDYKGKQLVKDTYSLYAYLLDGNSPALTTTIKVK